MFVGARASSRAASRWMAGPLGRRLSRPDLHHRAGAFAWSPLPFARFDSVATEVRTVVHCRERTASQASAGVISQRWSGNDRSPRRLGRVLMRLAESVDE